MKNGEEDSKIVLGLKHGQISIGTEVEDQNPNNLQKQQKWTFIVDDSTEGPCLMQLLFLGKSRIIQKSH